MVKSVSCPTPETIGIFESNIDYKNNVDNHLLLKDINSWDILGKIKLYRNNLNEVYDVYAEFQENCQKIL